MERLLRISRTDYKRSALAQPRTAISSVDEAARLTLGHIEEERTVATFRICRRSEVGLPNLSRPKHRGKRSTLELGVPSRCYRSKQGLSMLPSLNDGAIITVTKDESVPVTRRCRAHLNHAERLDGGRLTRMPVDVPDTYGPTVPEAVGALNVSFDTWCREHPQPR
jgi:hypothetical protein